MRQRRLHPRRRTPRHAAEDGAPASRVRLTNLDKVFWPAEGYTKGDLVRYYDAIAPMMLPYLRDRPIVLTRYPDGIAGKSFFQKDAPEFARALGPDGARPLEGHRPGHRILRRRPRRGAPVRGQPGHDPDPRVERAGPVARAPGLARPRPGPEGCALHRRGAGRAGRPSAAGRARAPEPREDVRGDRPPRPGPPGRAVHPRAGADPGAVAGHAGRGGRARNRHGGAPARRAGRQGLRRLRPERPRPDHRRALLGPAAAGRAGLMPPRVAGGDRPSRSGPLHDPHGAGALRAAARSAPAGPGPRDRAWRPCSRVSRRASERKSRPPRPRGGLGLPIPRGESQGNVSRADQVRR